MHVPEARPSIDPYLVGFGVGDRSLARLARRSTRPSATSSGALALATEVVTPLAGWGAISAPAGRPRSPPRAVRAVHDHRPRRGRARRSSAGPSSRAGPVPPSRRRSRDSPRCSPCGGSTSTSSRRTLRGRPMGIRQSPTATPSCGSSLDGVRRRRAPRRSSTPTTSREDPGLRWALAGRRRAVSAERRSPRSTWPRRARAGGAVASPGSSASPRSSRSPRSAPSSSCRRSRSSWSSRPRPRCSIEAISVRDAGGRVLAFATAAVQPPSSRSAGPGRRTAASSTQPGGVDERQGEQPVVVGQHAARA